MKPSHQQNDTDLIHNADFLKWILRPDQESDHFWETYLNENPTRKKEFEQARFLIKGLIKNEKTLSDEVVLELWNKIETTRAAKTARFIKIRKWSVAAGILLVLGLSGWLMTQTFLSKSSGIDYQAIAVNVDSGNEIKLIMANQTQKTFTTKQIELKYNKSGKLETKTDNEVQTEDLQVNAGSLQMNQLIVPRGKRSNIELADGTKLWLNSGSHAIYPVAFTGKTREIYIEGEAYLEVAHDLNKPFFVVTDQIKVKVLGTKFDISSYKDDDHVSVVLVEGSVLASSASEKMIMKPNQVFLFEKITERTTLETTNISHYISWKDGWILCNKEAIQTIMRKISRYYDIKISYNDIRINSMTLTGKLDLKNNFEDVLKVVCATAPLKYEMINNTIFLTPKSSN